MSRRVFIIDGARTPFLRNTGVRGPFSSVDLAVHATKSVLQKTGVPVEDIDQVILGSVMIEPTEVNPARILGVRVGVPIESPAFTVQRNCTSGLDAVDAARKDILLGISDVVLCGGAEAMSRAALQYDNEAADWFTMMPKMRTLSAKIKHFMKIPLKKFMAPTITLMEGLKDPFHKVLMGVTAENIAYMTGVDRQDMDEYSVQSHERSIATDFTGEIYPVYDSNGNLYETDSGVRPGLTVEKIGKMRAAFTRGGNVTAANSSQITDGAAMLILASEDYVKANNIVPISEIIGVEWAGVEPLEMGLGPVPAIETLLEKAEVRMDEVNHVEINEAFAGQVLACNTKLNIDINKLNPHGGAIAVGHPIGASLARLILHTSLNLDGYAIASGCVGGGQAGAILLKEVK